MLRSLSMLSLAIGLTACGGGSSPATPPLPPTPAPPAPAPQAGLTPSVGDFYSYKVIDTSTTPGAGQQTSTPSWYTDVVNEVEADGAWTDVTVGDDDALRVLRHYQANGDSDRYVNGGCTQSYVQTYSSARHDLVVGASWTSSVAYTFTPGCTHNHSISNSASTNVLALESVTVPAGTFNTVKVNTTRNFKYANGMSVTEVYTNWLDVDTHRAIKSTNQSTTLFTDTGETYTSTSGFELQGYSQAKTRRSVLNIERFAGPWAATYTGAYNGHCIGSMTTAGVFAADCDGGFNIRGNIDASGNMTLALYLGTTSGPQFSGSLNTALSLQGTWKFPDGTGGSWTLTHI